jgi:hypothetical protein
MIHLSPAIPTVAPRAVWLPRKQTLHSVPTSAVGVGKAAAGLGAAWHGPTKSIGDSAGIHIKSEYIAFLSLPYAGAEVAAEVFVELVGGQSE